ncbi:MAG: PAS domain S-box protein, partial [Nitrospirae bacterium]|nr:PAS domain S-box protein [Nitrospirota bacterium]
MKELEEYKPYGDLTELNKRRDLLDTVGKETLERIAKSYLDLLETSAAIYETDGSYATALFSSSYCKLMDAYSRKLCISADNTYALDSGKWLCHESCWTNASRITMETGEPYDLKPCEGGINIYAAPIKASGKIVGSINCGYGSPPSDDKTIDELAGKYKVDKKSLLQAAKQYRERPEYIVEAVKRNILLSAELIGGIYERNKLSAELSEKEQQLHTAFEFSTIGIAISSPEKGWLRVNDELCRMMGYTREELMRLRWPDITHPDDYQSSVVQVNRMLNGEIDGFSLDKRYIRKDGTVLYATVWINCKRRDDGTVDYYNAMVQDVTGRKKMEQELRLQGAIITNMEEGAVLIKAGDGTIVYANPKFNRIFGYEDGELTGRNISVVNAPTDISPEEVAEQIQASLKQTGSWEGEVFNIKKDGTRFWCHAIVSRFEHNTYGTVWVSTHQDITKRKEAEKKAWETGEQLRAIIDNSTAVIFLKDTEGKYLLINSQYEKLNNISRSEIIGKTDYELFPREVADSLRQNDNEVLLSLKPTRYIENVPDNDAMRVYLAIKFPLFDASAHAYGVCGIATDITELKRNEDIIRTELALKSSIAKVTGALLNPELDSYDISKVVYEEALILTGSKYGYASVIEDETNESGVVNPTYMPEIECSISNDKPVCFPKVPDGYNALCGHSLNTREGFYTNNPFARVADPSARVADPSARVADPSAWVADPSGHTAFKNRIPEAPPAGHFPIERFLSVPVMFSGRLIGQIVLANPVRDYVDSDLETVTRLASIYAIALERKKMEDSLRTEIASRQTAEVLLREKEVLLQEIHHRVKNNLQVVSGLIGLQMEYVLDETYREMFMESQNRIHSIAMVHEKLYRSRGFTNIDLKEYVTDLASDLFTNFTIDKNNVILNIDIEHIPIGIDVAIPCGLIINELFTNVLKHAFPRGSVCL